MKKDGDLIKNHYVNITKDEQGNEIALDDIIWPTTKSVYAISSYFGYRWFNNLHYWHEGIDVPIVKGTTVKAVGKGKVVIGGLTRGYGKVVYINHGVKDGKGVVTRYAHLDTLAVEKGEKITANEIGMEVGKSGNSPREDNKGYHLHFEIDIYEYKKNLEYDGSVTESNVVYTVDPFEFLHDVNVWTKFPIGW